MKRFRYDTRGRWFKGNTHIHTTNSDGGLTPDEVAHLYAPRGYQFLVRADHWAASRVASERRRAPLLWLDGLELDGRDQTESYFHVVCLGRVAGIRKEMTLVEAMLAARGQGALLILAHPHWCGNTFEDALRHEFDGVEIYNHVCHWLNGKSSGLAHWDVMLERNADVLGLAADDAHIRPEHPGWDGGWIVVNAPRLSRPAVMKAIRAGNYYSSCGPEFHSIEFDGAAVRIRTSPVAFARLVGPGWRGARFGSFSGDTMTEACFTVPDDWATARIEIEDLNGRRAWTNTLFTGEQK